MNLTMSPQKFARLGVFCLKEAVLDILEQPQHREIGLKPADISDILGVKRADRKSLAAPIISGILWELEVEGHVTQNEKYGPWRLAE